MSTQETRTTTFTTPTDRELVMTHVVDAPRQLVFDAWTQPQHVPHWLLGPAGWSMPVCEIDLRPGGAWRFVWRKSDGAEMEMRGAYREVTAPERVVTTESWGAEWPETVNTLTLSEHDGKTTITQTVLYPSKQARDAATQTGMKDGVSQSFARLDDYLQGLSAKAAATQQIFVNLPVKNLDRSVQFFSRLGYRFNPKFTDQNATCMIVGENIYVMLLVESFFKTFTPKALVDATKSTEVILSLSAQSRAGVDELVAKAVAAGATTPNEAKDYGFMYQHGYQDLDGHLWEVIYMDPNAECAGQGA